jgi:5-hydroxyisourate hydrolase-like protein (transthyretin family)
MGTKKFVKLSRVNADGSLAGWQDTTPLPVDVEGHTMVAHNNRLYVMAPTGKVYYATINQNDGTVVGNWQETTPFSKYPTGLYSSFVNHGYIYLLGDQSNKVRYVKILDNGQLDKWQETTPLPEGRYSVFAGARDCDFYVVGGLGPGGFKNTVYHAKATAPTFITLNITDTEICEYGATMVNITGTVDLPATFNGANLRTRWREIKPEVVDWYYNDNITVDNSQTFPTSFKWPGVNETDKAVEVEFEASLHDQTTQQQIGQTVKKSFSWNPTMCPTPWQPMQMRITGRVTSKAGTPLAGIRVELLRKNGQGWHQENIVGITNDAGNYALNNLVPGEYIVRFVDPTHNYRTEYYEDNFDITSAKLVTIERGQTTSNINAVLEMPEPNGTVIGGDASIGTDDEGKLIIQTWPNSDLIITREATCSDGSVPEHVSLEVDLDVHGTFLFEMQPSETDASIYQIRLNRGPFFFENGIEYTTLNGVKIPAGGRRYDLNMTIECADQSPQTVNIGMMLLHDPRGLITDVVTGEPIAGAIVTLYKVPGWRPRNAMDAPNEPSTCQSHLTKADDEAWSQTAPTQLGIFADPNLHLLTGKQEISPTINPQITGDSGLYAWDVATGCWYVTVQAEGYHTKVSPVVGVPPEVTDLHVALRPIDLPEIPKATLTLIQQANLNSPITYTSNISGASSFSLKTGQPYTLTDIMPGTAIIAVDSTSYPDSHWALISVSCQDQNEQPVAVKLNRDKFQVEISLQAEQHLTCNFLSERAGYDDGRSFAVHLPIVIR